MPEKPEQRHSQVVLESLTKSHWGQTHTFAHTTRSAEVPEHPGILLDVIDIYGPRFHHKIPDKILAGVETVLRAHYGAEGIEITKRGTLASIPRYTYKHQILIGLHDYPHSSRDPGLRRKRYYLQIYHLPK